MEPRIETLKEKKLIGMNQIMSLTNNLTGKLWSEFSPRIHEGKLALESHPRELPLLAMGSTETEDSVSFRGQ